MRLRPGCGCLLLGLGLVDVIIVILAIVSAVRQTLNVGQASLVVLVCGGNATAALMLGWVAFRGRSIGGSSGSERAESLIDEVSGVEVEEGTDDEER